MPSRTEALSIDTASWTLRLKTTAAPDEQLSKLARLLGRPVDDPSLQAAVEARVPGAVEISFPNRPRIFENTVYTLSVKPKSGFDVVRVGHPTLRDIEDSIDDEDGVWRGTLRTGNDIGWFPLEIVVRPNTGGPLRTDRIAWQVWPLKLDFASDLKLIATDIEAVYPLWLFKFGVATEHDLGVGRGRSDRFLLMWFAQFRSRWDELERGLKVILQNPHVSLQSRSARLRAERLRGRINRRLEERIAVGGERPEIRYEATVWSSSLDTPENRFVLYVLDKCLSSLDRFRDAVDRPGLSPTFRALLDGWIRSVSAFRSDPMFHGVGTYFGLSKESLVLHNRAGYATTYRAWLELRRDLEFFASASAARLGMRSVNELYEIWCFLAIRRMLSDLGFRESERKEARWRKVGLEREMENGAGASFRFEGNDGLRLELSHEPVFGRFRSGPFHSATIPQRPDIVLEARWPASDEMPERRLLWIFDAKYRLMEDAAAGSADRDDEPMRDCDYLVPPDAIDQMHRYRDSILMRTEGSESRPVVSAFALYPGIFDQTRSPAGNPYAQGIQAVGIGAFPLLPSMNGDLWLRAYMDDALRSTSHAKTVRKRSVRIPVSGLEYPEDDVLIVYLTADRRPEYLERFREGRSELYHTYLQGGPSSARLGKVKFLVAIDVPHTDGPLRMIRGAYAIDGWSVVARSELDTAAAGSPQPRDAGAKCRILRLGRYLQLASPIPVPREPGNWFRYASLQRLFEARTFADLWSIKGE